MPSCTAAVEVIIERNSGFLRGRRNAKLIGGGLTGYETPNGPP